MSISYPLPLPTATGLSSIKISAKPTVGITRSPFTGTQQVQVHAGQWWEVEVSLPPLTDTQAQEWLSFLLKLNGQEGTFLLGDPVKSTPAGTATGTPLINGSSQSGNQLITDGWTPNVTGILKAGDYIQLGSSSNARLYKILEDTNSDSGGNATLCIWPKLRTSPANNDPITTHNTVGVFRLSHNDIRWDISTARHYGISFSAREAL